MWLHISANLTYELINVATNWSKIRDKRATFIVTGEVNPIFYEKVTLVGSFQVLTIYALESVGLS